MVFDDRPEPAKRLEQARVERGFKSAAAACTFFGWNYTSYAQHENGTRGLGRAAAKYAKAYRVSEAWLLTGEGPERARQIQKVGYVGAGQAIVPFEADESEWVDAPPDVAENTVAVEVRGESMLPAYEDGFLLYYSQKLPPEQMVNKRCVVQLANGSMLVKTLRRGTTPGYWNLGSLNAYDIEDQVVEWAAPIDWIKPRK